MLQHIEIHFLLGKVLSKVHVISIRPASSRLPDSVQVSYNSYVTFKILMKYEDISRILDLNIHQGHFNAFMVFKCLCLDYMHVHFVKIKSSPCCIRTYFRLPRISMVQSFCKKPQSSSGLSSFLPFRSAVSNINCLQ